MKNLLITSAVLAMLAAPAMAVELTSKLSLDNTIEATYAFEAKDYAISYSPELSYGITEGLRTYINTEFDLQDPIFTGSVAGIEYVPTKFNKLTLSAEAYFDADMKYTDTVLQVAVTF
jgi:hypothetical protein